MNLPFLVERFYAVCTRALRNMPVSSGLVVARLLGLLLPEGKKSYWRGRTLSSSYEFTD